MDRKPDPMTSKQEAACAHMRVAYMTTNIRDVTQGWWECTTCGHKFAPVPKEPLTSKDPHCEHGYDVQEAICPVCKDGEFAHPPSNDQLPPDGKIDGDGVWRGGKWHPNEPLPSNPILDRLIHLQKFEWIKNHDTYNAGMSTREGRAALAEIERLRAALEWYANTSEAPKRALEALRGADETSEATCAVCGEHANEHLAIPHQFMPGGKAT